MRSIGPLSLAIALLVLSAGKVVASDQMVFGFHTGGSELVYRSSEYYGLSFSRLQARESQRKWGYEAFFSIAPKMEQDFRRANSTGDLWKTHEKYYAADVMITYPLAPSIIWVRAGGGIYRLDLIESYLDGSGGSIDRMTTSTSGRFTAGLTMRLHPRLRWVLFVEFQSSPIGGGAGIGWTFGVPQ